MDKIVVWGTGKIAKELMNSLEQMKYYRDNIVAFCDNDSKKWNTEFCGNEVVSPNELDNLVYDYLVIATVHEDEIRNQISLHYPRMMEKAMNWVFYRCHVNSANKYWMRCGKPLPANYVENENKAVVYTAVTGDYDKLLPPEFTDPSIEYVCFTNSTELCSDIWNIRYVHNDGLSNVMLARNIKLFPHKYLGYKGVSYWVDAKYRIQDDLREYRKRYWRNRGMLCFPHFMWADICDELSFLIGYRPDGKKVYITQVADYIREGFPIDFGNYDTGVLVRDTSNDEVRSLMDLWWNQLIKYTYRDQLSFQYLLWKYDFMPDICDLFIEDNRWLTVGRQSQ